MKGKRRKNQMTSCNNTPIKKETGPAKQHQSPITSYFSPNNLKNLNIDDKDLQVKKQDSLDKNSDADVKENIECKSLNNIDGSKKCQTVKKKSARAAIKELPKQAKLVSVKDHTYCKEEISIKAPAPKVSETSKNKKDVKSAINKQITEYFPIRRSDRKTKKTIQMEKQEQIKEILLSETDPSHLQICEFEGKGRGVVTSKFCARGDFVVEYSGELIDPETAKLREFQYSCDEKIGCYMYYFSHNDKQYCVDATAETGRLGRLINHSKKEGNLITKTFVVNKTPRLILIAKRDIFEKEELLYDYGDRRNSSLQNHPWLSE